MFVVFDMSDERKRLFEKYRKHEVTVIRHDVRSCAPFFVAKSHKKYCDFEQLNNLAKRYGCFLADERLKLPDYFDCVKFKPQILPLKMLIKSATLALAKKGKSNITVTVIDEAAKATNEVEQLVLFARSVRVITSKPQLYSQTLKNVFVDFGAVIMLSDNYSTAYGSDIIISLDDSNFKGFDYGKIIVYQKHFCQDNIYSFCDCDFKFRSFDSEAVGVDRYLFLCALYETCGYKFDKLPVFNGAEKLFSNNYR